MIFIGEFPVGTEMNLNDMLDFKNINNFFYGQSGSFFVQNLIYNLYNSFFVNSISLNSILILISSVYFILFVKKKQHLIFIILITTTSFLSQILISDFYNIHSSPYKFGLFKNLCLGLNSFLTFLFPFYLILKSNIQKTIKHVFLILLVTSLLSLIIFGRGSTENYYFIEILVMYLLLLHHENDLVRLKPRVIFSIFILITMIPRFDDSHTFFLKTSEFKFDYSDKTDKISEDLNINEKIINLNVYGKRNYYSKKIPDIYSVSREFLNLKN